MSKQDKMRVEGSGSLTTKPYPDRYQSEQEFKRSLAQPEQEPVQNMKTYEIVCPHCDNPHDWTYLQREWAGLTEDEFEKILERHNEATPFAVYLSIEAKLKEKNT